MHLVQRNNQTKWGFVVVLVDFSQVCNQHNDVLEELVLRVCVCVGVNES